ncbi:MAG: TonB-dependent siderophore receptor [Pseudomonadota bacterium]
MGNHWKQCAGLSAIVAVAMTPSWATAQTSDDASDAVIETDDVIIVQGRAQRLYRVDDSPTGKLPTDPLSSPISITSINDQLISDQGARDAQDIYRNISGVSVFSYAGVTARGFRQEEIFFDGLRGDPYAGFAVPQLFNVAQVDFLKGPAGMLYGPGAPGGIFNYITKKPTEDFAARLEAIYGTEGRFGGSAEINGALPVDGLVGRAGFFYENRETARDNTDSETIIYDLGLGADLGFAEFTLQGTRYEQDLQGNRLRGVPVNDDGDFLADRRWNHNEPDDFLDLVSNNVQAKLEGEIGDFLTWDAAVRYTDSEENQEYHEPRTLEDTDGDGIVDFLSVREFRDQTREEESITFGANAIWSAQFGPVENRLLVGVDHFNGDQTFFFDRGRGPGDNILGISLIDPLYGVSDRTTYILGNIADGTVSEQTRQGVYLLEELTIGNLTLTGGVRFDRFKDKSNVGTEFEDNFDDERATFRAGAVYKILPEVSVFAQWAESYEPQGIGDQDPRLGGPFDPSEGEIIEAGIKTGLFGGRIQSSLSFYDIARTNLLQNSGEDPGGDGFDDLVAFGEVTSRGVEFEVAADVTPDWVVTAAYAYNDAKVTEETGAAGTDRIRNRVGDRFANAPEHQFGFWTRYQVPAIKTAFAFGGDYVSDQFSLNGQTVQSYFVFDASIIWSPGPVEVLLRIDNLFDETYAVSGFLERTGHFPGDPRSIFVEISKDW